MSDNTTPKGPAKQPGTSQTTQKGPWGGSNKYGQMPVLGSNFVAVPPIKGHTQRQNIKYKRPGEQ